MTRFYTILIVVSLFISNVRADHIIIGDGAPFAIGASRTLGDSDLYDNKGVLEVLNGTLKLSAGVKNINSLGADSEGLNLGVVINFGTVDAEQIIRFQEGSQISGSIISTENIIFDGASELTGNVKAKKLVFNASQNEKEGKALITEVDLTGSNIVDVGEWVVNGSVHVTKKAGEALTVESLVVSGQLDVSEDIIVTGNYTGAAGAVIASKLDDQSKPQGAVILLGGGPLDGGTNNLIMQSSILASELQVQNHTTIVQQLSVYGAMTVLSPKSGSSQNSFVDVQSGLRTGGLMTVESGGTLQLRGDAPGMNLFGNELFNGLFFGGLYLKDDAILQAAAADQNLSIALGKTSQIDSGAKMTAKDIHLAGVDTAENTKVQDIGNYGTLNASGQLRLSAIQFANFDDGELKINRLKLENESVLNLTESDLAENCGLTFIGNNPSVEISGDSVIVAAGKTLNFTGVEVINHNNTSTAIQTAAMIFGAGGSLAGAGGYSGNATFESGSKIKLDYNGHLYFGSTVLLQRGASIELTIGGTNGNVGAIVANGKVTMEEGVILEIANGSDYNDRAKWFQIIQGTEDSQFTQLTLNSLFFKLTGIAAEKGGLFIELFKTGHLVDYVNSSNQRNLGLLMDELLDKGIVGEQQKAVFDALMQIGNDTAYQQGLDSLSGAARENGILFALSSPWRTPLENIGFNRLSLTLGTNHTSALDQERTTTLGQRLVPKSKELSPRWSPSYDLWGNVYYNYSKFDADANAPGGNGSRGGFYAGTALPSPSKESLLGLSVGYSAGKYKQLSDKVDLGDFQFGVYGGINLFARNLQLRGYVGYGVQDYKMNRHVFGSIPVSGKTSGDSMAAALYLIRPVDISERYLLKPTLGFDIERLSQDGFTETGSEAAALSYNDTKLARTMFRIGLTGDYTFDRFALNGRFLYGLKLAGDSAVSSDHRFASSPDYYFRTESVNLGSNMFDLGFGGNFGLNRMRTALLFLDYNAGFGKNSNAHTGSLGVLWKR